jgi:ubiquinone/menaquinone biosynthesis C-methylase UbiE
MNARGADSRKVAQLTDLASRKAFYSSLTEDLHAAALDAAELDGSETILDIGSGSGHYLRELSSRGHQGMVIGLDISAPMLEVARSRQTNALLVRGDALVLPFPSLSADVVLLMHMLYDVSCPSGVVAEASRVLRPNGLLVVYLHRSEHLSELNQVIGTSASIPTGMIYRIGWNYLNFPAELGEELLRASFTSVRVQEIRSRMEFTDSKDILNYMISAPLFEDIEKTERQRILAQGRESIEGQIKFGGSFQVSIRSACFLCSEPRQ